MKNSACIVLLFLFAFANAAWWLPAPARHCAATETETVWGFFGHRKINRPAVYSLPPEMMVFFKPNIDYLTEHAVDADMRRYASKYEAPRHYIDLDRYGEPPFPALPRNWTDALLCHSDYFFLRQNGDTLPLFSQPVVEAWLGPDSLLAMNPATGVGEQVLSYRQMRSFFREEVLPLYYEDEWRVSADSFQLKTGVLLPDCEAILVVDTFSQHGIVPYQLERLMGQLTAAFRKGDTDRILRYAADLGHYMADAHVPLHTTENYNGQLTNQLGIHAFWESRLPELFADEYYDFWVGKAGYILDQREFFWNTVMESHSLVDSVLTIEKELSQQYPPDQQYCTEWRGNSAVTVPCEAYSRAYHDRLGGMVERRMREAILAVSSAWYTAWVDAGQPDLRPLAGIPLPPEEAMPADSLQQPVKPLRPHEGE